LNYLILLYFILIGATPGLASAESPLSSTRLVVHLLDYLAKDYGGAVEKGVIISAGEYAEQEEFAKIVVETVGGEGTLAENAEIVDGVNRIKVLISTKAEAVAVAQLARLIQAQVIKVANLTVAPDHWPSVSNGRELFAQDCASCHGANGKGDGPGGVGLDPQPANFMAEGMVELSPFQAFNTIRLGVPGTGMAPFQQLSDSETWDLAFFIVSMRHTTVAAEVADLSFDNELLLRAATKSDAALSKELALAPGKIGIIPAMRLHEHHPSSIFPVIAEENLGKVLVASRRGDLELARTFALKAYLEGVEPSEPRLRASDPEAVIRLEERMSAVRSDLEAAKSAAEVEFSISLAVAELRTAAEILKNKNVSPYMTFISAAAIILREGFEAVLLILALLGVIRAASATGAARWVHAGWIAALGCGVIAWFLSGYLLDMSGASRELMEAVTALFAVSVLLYVGFWMHRQTEIGRWRAFLDGKVQALLAGKNLLGLAFISFLAVFRETFETVLFLRSIWVETGDDGRMALGTGVLASLVLLFFLAWALLRSSTRLPIRKLFSVSAAIMGLLAILFTGKGLHSLQEAGRISVSSAPSSPRFDLLGLYPTWETITGQVIVIFILIAIWFHGNRPTKRSALAIGDDAAANG
jgi:high-affinity iron transporter